MKKHLTTILLILVLLAGLGLILYPTVSDWWNQNVATHSIVNYESALAAMTTEDYTELFAAADEYNRKLFHMEFPLIEHDEIEGYNELLSIEGSNVMGYIEIEKINVHLPIYHGTSSSVLTVGVGHVEGSSLPVGGESTHAVLSAHRGLPRAKLFTDLDKVEPGDVFTISVLDRVLTYQVDQILIVLPHEVDALKIEEGEDYCTLVTCTPYSVNSHRMLVRGRRIETDTPLASLNIRAELRRVDPLIVAPFLLVPILILILIFLSAYDRRRRRYDREKIFDVE